MLRSRCRCWSNVQVIYGMVTPVRVCLRCNGHVIRCEDFATAVTRNEILMVKKMLSEKKYKVHTARWMLLCRLYHVETIFVVPLATDTARADCR